MSNLIVCDPDLTAELDLVTGKALTVHWKTAVVHVYQNNHTPAHGDVLGAYTEATWPGYASQALTPSTWPASSISAHVASAQYAATITFERSSTGTAQSAYGIYVTDSGGTILLAAASFDGGPYTMQNAGDQINETLTLQLASLY